MVGAIVISPTDAASQEARMGSAQHVLVARVWASRDAAVQHYCLDYLGSEHPDFELDGSARSVIIQFEGVLPEIASCVAYAPIDLDRQFGVVVGVPLEVYELVRLVKYLPRCLYAECRWRWTRASPSCVNMTISVLTSDTMRPNAAHTTTITPIIFLGCSGECETTPASST